MLDKNGGAAMADQHQVNSIVATAICDARKEDPDHRMDPEEAKQIAKCIVEALTDAGLQIVPITKE
jgi:predicted ATPase